MVNTSRIRVVGASREEGKSRKTFGTRVCRCTMSSCRKSDDVTGGMKTMGPRRGFCQVSSRSIEITLSERTHTLLVVFVDIAKFERPSLQIILCFLDPVDIQRASFPVFIN